MCWKGEIRKFINVCKFVIYESVEDLLYVIMIYSNWYIKASITLFFGRFMIFTKPMAARLLQLNSVARRKLLPLNVERYLKYMNFTIRYVSHFFWYLLFLFRKALIRDSFASSFLISKPVHFLVLRSLVCGVLLFACISKCFQNIDRIYTFFKHFFI